MSNNSTLLVESGTPIVVEQGPRWLVDIVYAPPSWMQAGLLVTVGVFVAGGIYALTRVDTSPAVLREIASNLLLAGFIGGVTHLSVTFLAVGYLLDIGVGVVGGVLVTEIVVTAYDRSDWQFSIGSVDLD